MNISRELEMKNRKKCEDPWIYATYKGVERLQLRQTARMTFSERLQALDDMIHLARGLQKSKRSGFTQTSILRNSHDPKSERSNPN